MGEDKLSRAVSSVYAKMGFPAPLPNAPAVPPVEPRWPCPRCGTLNELTAVTCRQCNPPVEPPQWGEPRWHPKRMYYVIEATCGCWVTYEPDPENPDWEGRVCQAHPFAVLDEGLRRLREAADGK